MEKLNRAQKCSKPRVKGERGPGAPLGSAPDPSLCIIAFVEFAELGESIDGTS